MSAEQQLPYFDSSAACVKCGCAEVRAIYAGDYEHRTLRCSRNHPTEEHIDRVCCRCGFMWTEKCLDIVCSVTMSPDASPETVEALAQTAALAAKAMREGKL